MKPNFIQCALLAILLLNGCSQTARNLPAATTSATSNVEATTGTSTNPPGDIPDTQAFVAYASPNGYDILFPEGWTQTENGSTVTFTWHFDGEQIVMQKPIPPVASVRSRFTDVRDINVRHVSIKGMPAIVLSFSSRSSTDPVTGRSVRLENAAYVFTKGSRQALVTLWAPQGSDNVDQWRKISESFHWK